MSFPRYPAYKDSGVAWLGPVPSHWAVKRLRRVVQLNPSKSETAALSRSSEVTFLPMEAIGEDGSLALDRLRPIGELESGYTYFAEGDVAIAKITPCFENGKGAVMRGLHGGLGFGTTELIVARPLPKHLDSGYLHRIFTSRPFMQQGEASMYGAGGQKRVPDDFVRDFAIALPPVDEQVVINAFLDRETAKIDALVAEQEQLINLLKEKRQAVISHAVTKGLDPSVPMKDSGVEWLGEVPAHWDVRQVRSVSSFITSGPRGWSERIADEGALFIQSGDLTESLGIDFGQAKRVAVQQDAETSRTRLLCGDVVVCITGAKTGNVAVAASVIEDAYVNQHLCLIRPTTDVLPHFLGVFLKSDAGQRYFAIAQYGLKQGLSLESIKAAPVAVPPVSEQAAIVAFVEKATTQVDQLIGEAVLSIELLRERRSVLISAAVTGQIDVRGLAPAQEQAA